MAVSFFTATRRSLNFRRNWLNLDVLALRVAGLFRVPPVSPPCDTIASTSSRLSRRRPLMTSSTDRSFSSITFFASGVNLTLSYSLFPGSFFPGWAAGAFAVAATATFSKGKLFSKAFSVFTDASSDLIDFPRFADTSCFKDSSG